MGMSGLPPKGCLSELLELLSDPSLLCIPVPQPQRAETDESATYGSSSPKREETHMEEIKLSIVAEAEVVPAKKEDDE